MILNIVRLAFLILIFTAAPAGAQDATTYVVRPGDTLYRISRMHDVPVDRIRRLNALEDNVIQVGQVLVLSGPGDVPAPVRSDVSLPEGERPQTALSVPPDEPSASAQDVIRDSGHVTSDEPPVSPERRLRMDADPLRSEDGQRPESGGRFEPIDSTSAGAAGRRVAAYVVRAGDTIFSVAARFGTAAYLLYTLNDGITAPLEPGSELKVPAEAARGIIYHVRSGDTLFRIARHFGISVGDIRRANSLAGDELRIGQTLRIPVDPEGSVAIPGQERLPAVYATGPVTVYPETFSGRLTAAGRPYDPAGFTVSHRSLPLGTIVLVENPATGQSTFAEVGDRGPLEERHLMDVSAAVAGQLGLDTTRAQPVSIRIIE